jgi:hypothetical protein
MTFIQLSLLEVAAIVKCGNSLTDEVVWQRETLWYHKYDIGRRLMKQENDENNDKGSKKDNKKLLNQQRLF